MRGLVTAKQIGRLCGWCLAAFALAFTLLSIVSGTLCTGADGHVALEPAQVGRCVDGGAATDGVDRRSAVATAAPSFPDAGCGPCTDLALSVGGWVGNAKLAPIDGDPMVAVAAGLPAALLHEALPNPPLQAHERPPATHPARRVTLRC